MPSAFIKKIEHGFKKGLKVPFFMMLKKGDRSRVPLQPENIKSILILRPDKLGDMIATIPTIHALKKLFAYIRIEVLASPRNNILVAEDPLIDELYLYHKNILKDWPLIRKLKKKHFDLIYDPICHDSVTGLLLGKLISNNSVFVASRKLNHAKYYDYCEPYLPDGDDHNVDNGLLIFNALGVQPETIDPFLPVYLKKSSRQKADRFFAGLPTALKFWIGINISAGSPTRSLSLDKYASILKSLSDIYPDAGFVISCVSEDRETAKKLALNIKTRSYLIPENLSLLDVAAIIEKLDIFISPDTSLIHMARLMQIPVVGLYSGHKRNFNFWRPYRQKYGAIISANLNNIFDIEPKQVVDEFRLVYDSLARSSIQKAE